MNYKYALFTTLVVSGVIALASRSAQPQEKPRTPADGHEIHVLAPHKMDSKVMGPYHHYCKAVSSEVLECLIYESTEPNALLKQVEYFVAKSVSRTNVPLETWNKFYHDHAVEIATGSGPFARGGQENRGGCGSNRRNHLPPLVARRCESSKRNGRASAVRGSQGTDREGIQRQVNAANSAEYQSRCQAGTGFPCWYLARLSCVPLRFRERFDHAQPDHSCPPGAFRIAWNSEAFRTVV